MIVFSVVQHIIEKHKQKERKKFSMTTPSSNFFFSKCAPDMTLHAVYTDDSMIDLVVQVFVCVCVIERANYILEKMLAYKLSNVAHN